MHEIQALEQRVSTAENERANVTSLYFKLESELKQAGQRTAELEVARERTADLEQQLGAKHIAQTAAAEELQSAGLDARLAPSGPGLVQKLRGIVGTGPDMLRSKRPRSGNARRAPAGIATSRFYDERVTIHTASGEILGTARLVGQANYSRNSGTWGWQGQLFDTSFEPDILRQSRELRIELNDGTDGRAICDELSYQNAIPSIHLIGTGTPPRVS